MLPRRRLENQVTTFAQADAIEVRIVSKAEEHLWLIPLKVEEHLCLIPLNIFRNLAVKVVDPESAAGLVEDELERSPVRDVVAIVDGPSPIPPAEEVAIDAAFFGVDENSHVGMRDCNCWLMLGIIILLIFVYIKSVRRLLIL